MPFHCTIEDLKYSGFFSILDNLRRPFASSALTCWTSAVVERNSSMYLEPIFSLCFCRAFSASFSWAKRTKASPVARPSGFFTKRTPSSPSTKLQAVCPLAKKSIWKCTFDVLRILLIQCLFWSYHLLWRSIIGQSTHTDDHLCGSGEKLLCLGVIA